MANNCLVTKLKGVVDNDSLPVFNALRIYVDVAQGDNISQRTIQIYNEGEFTMKAVGGTMRWSSEPEGTAYTEISGSNSPTIVFNPGKYTVYFTSKYGINGFAPGQSGSIKNFTVDLSDLYNLATMYVQTYRTTGDIRPMNVLGGDIMFYDATSLDISAMYDKSTMDLSIFRNCTDLTRMQKQTGISGNILDLSKSIGLTYISFRNPGVYGEINDLAASMRANGRTSGTLSIESCLSNITDDGNIISHEYIVSKGGQYVVSVNFTEQGYTKTYT